MNEHSSEHAVAAAEPHSVEDAKRHMRTYAIVGVALMIGTAMTVWASYADFGSRKINIVVALAIAITKGSLVAGFFMHLISEKKMIYSVMACTVFFFGALMFLTLWSMHHPNIVHFQQ
ncbi:MAG: cytochrome C oxidase subunit IV family protein [Verrucomicrobiota bacterium]|jgi:cytochrome c oxidase subunit 4